MFGFKFKKRELTEEQQKFLYQSGEKFADKIHLKDKINAINNFGTRKPKLFFTIVFGIIIGLLIISFIIPTTADKSSVKMEVPDKGLENISSSEDDFKKEMLAIYTEMEMITDTLLIMMEKKNLSTEDSVFMVEKYSRLEKLNYIINQELNLEKEK